MKEFDLTSEIYREYDFIISDVTDFTRIYQIEYPVKLYISESGTTHRVLDSEGVVHCVPAPGYHGCVLRWVSFDDDNQVAF